MLEIYKSTKRVISYLKYLRDISRKIVIRNGFEKCLLDKLNRYALQLEELPEKIDIRNKAYDKIKPYYNFINETYDKKAFLGYGLIAGTKSRLYAAPMLYLECEIYKDKEVFTVEPDIDTLRFNYDLISAMSDRLYDENLEEESIDYFDNIERDLIADIESQIEAMKEVDNKKLSEFAENIFIRFSEKSDAFKDIKRYGKKYVFDVERDLFDHRTLRKKNVASGSKSVFEQPLCYIAANHLFVTNIPNALSTYKALDAFVQKILQGDNFDNETLEKLLMNAISDDKTPITSLENQKQTQEIINSALPLPLSSSQNKAIQNAWAHDISYIQGPPGTGKSYTISALVLTALAVNKKVLVVSQKSAALKVVKEKVEPLLTNENDAIIGICYFDAGTSARNSLRNYCRYLSGYAYNLRYNSELTKLQHQIDDCQKYLNKKFEELREQEERLSSALEALRMYNEANEDFIRERDRFSKQIEYIPSQFTFVQVNNIDKYRTTLERVGRLEKTYKTLASRLYLKKFKEHLISCFKIDAMWIKDRGLYDFADALVKLYALFYKVKQSEKKITVDINIVRTKICNINKDISDKKKVFVKLNYRYRVLQNFISNTKERNPKDEIDKFRGMLVNINEKLIQQKMSKIDFSLVTDAMPFWAAEIRNLGRLLPLEAGLFDFVIVDESSQVNLAEIIPAFYRGKHICIVGDHAQLGLGASGLTFALKGRYDELCWEKYNKELPFKKAKDRDLIVSKSSILDFIKNENYEPYIPETMLDEHYRSLPHLASYTNRQFYSDEEHPEGKLLIMTETPQQMEINCFQAIKVQGKRGSEENTNAKYILEEAEEVIKIVKCLVEPTVSSKYKLPNHIQNKKFTIGILSMIRDQVNLIKEMLQEDFPNGLEKYGINPDSNFGIGTAEEFQGNERDIMIISLCLDKNGRSFGFHQDNKRLNVATSRAKSFTFIVYSPFPKTFAKLYEYIAYAGGKLEIEDSSEEQGSIVRRNLLSPIQHAKIESDFERLVYEYLNEYIKIKMRENKHQITLHNQVKVCGQKRLDFVLYNHTTRKFAAVEVDGRFHFDTYQPSNYTSAHIERMNILTRAGWNIINTPYYRWYNNGWLCENNVPIFKNELSRIYGELDKYMGI